MSRVAFALTAGALAAIFSLPALAAEPVFNQFGLAVAPQSGNASIHQWGGVDDNFAVNPGGDEVPAKAGQRSSALAQNQQDADDSDQGEPGPAEDEVLTI